MGYWSDKAAEFERVLGDELNPTDAYGERVVFRPAGPIRLGSWSFQDFRRDPTGPSTGSVRAIPAGYGASEEEGGGRGIPVPEWPWPLPAVPGSKRWEENKKLARDIESWFRERADRAEERRRQIGEPHFMAPPGQRTPPSTNNRRKYFSEDECLAMYYAERSDCGRKYGRYIDNADTKYIFDGCMDRARYRWDMCVRGERPDDFPSPWGPGDFPKQRRF